MTMPVIVEIIASFGFPIACVIVMGWFIYKIYKNTTAASQQQMTELQNRCLAREDKLYQELEKSRNINAQAIDTIARYAEKLEVIQHDVSQIKIDIVKMSEKID